MERKTEIVKSHSRLAEIIKGKSVLHCNSFGKDSAVCIEWLANFAKPSRIVAVNYEFISKHPDDEKYLAWQKSRYKNVEFITAPNPHELTNICAGMFQNPVNMLDKISCFEYDRFLMRDYNNEILKNMSLDYVCLGLSRYESVSRATQFHKKGILRENKIYPIGFFSKKEIINLIKLTKIKLHPCYKFAQSTFDTPSYYKMRSAFIANPEYKENVLKAYPLLCLDEYRMKVLFKK